VALEGVKDDMKSTDMLNPNHPSMSESKLKVLSKTEGPIETADGLHKVVPNPNIQQR
jgi:hypothetical protein